MYWGGTGYCNTIPKGGYCSYPMTPRAKISQYRLSVFRLHRYKKVREFHFNVLLAFEICRILIKRAWNYDLISLVTIWLRILMFSKYSVRFSKGTEVHKWSSLPVGFGREKANLVNTPYVHYRATYSNANSNAKARKFAGSQLEMLA